MTQDIIINSNQEITLPILWSGEAERINYNIRLAGRGAKLKLPALLLGRKSDKLDIKINVYHEKPDTQSKVILKGVLKDNAFINFEGLVKIEKGARGTNAWLGAHILLLSDTAKGRAVPGLEILDNDIKAGHAATVGRINEMELFYLQSRGISEKDSKSLIVQGFINSITQDFPADLVEKIDKEINYI